MDTPRSLVLISVDCLRADHVGFLGYERPTTPFLDSLAKENLAFSNAIVAGAPTYYSLPAIMASRYPLALGRDVIGLAPDELTIASLLNQAGYATSAFLAGNPYLSRRFGYDAGFDTFRDFLDVDIRPLPNRSDGAGKSSLRGKVNHGLAQLCHKLGPVGSAYDELYFQYCQRVAAPPLPSLDVLRRFPSADVIVDHAQTWLAGVAGRPFFMWIHFMDPHSPYYPRAKALERMGHDQPSTSQARYLNSYWNRGDLTPERLKHHRDEVIALYDAGIRWVDEQVARLVGSLRDSHQWDSCVLALTADHGEEFLEHGGRYHPPSKVTEELIRVPLLLRAPGVSKRKLVVTPFSLVDLAPTLLEAVSVPVPGSFRGTSHFGQLHRGEKWEGTAVVESVGACTNPFLADNRLGARILAIREEHYKLVLDFGSSREQLFELKADPSELFPLPPDAEKPVRRRLLDRARHHIADSLQLRDPDQRLGARLRDLRLEWAHSATKVPA